MELKSYLGQRQALINRTLEKILPSTREYPGQIHQAMRYSVLGEGKRIRPILAVASCEAVGGKVGQVLHAACALELIHAYSLVHDDLPAMDNDDFRRGKPSCHKQFGEAIGILTGDALLTLSFDLLARGNKPGANGSTSVSRGHHGSPAHLKVIREVAGAIGTKGMIGGQVVDIDSARGSVLPSTQEYINTRKTGALIGAAVRVGALLGGATQLQYRALSRYGDRIGLVFQWVDDLLDGDGAVEIFGISVVRRKAEKLTDQAMRALSPFGHRGEPLRALAEFILTRKY